jgi:acetylornithine deacetylase/succinyl-diaminopimelate desuccinylase-like protein
MLSCVLKVEVLTEATHSGIASGIVPSSMRIMRLLLDRLEDSQTGEILVKALHADIPTQRLEQAAITAAILGDSILSSFNVVPGLQPVAADSKQLLLNNTWRPTLSVVGQQGLPQVKDAGNVTRAYTALKLSFRLPPSLSVNQAKTAIENTLLRDPPYDARISLSFDQGGDGWDAPPLADWLQQANLEASQHYFGKDAVYFGLGASIPFMSMLGKMYPAAQFLITGVLGPKSNAHGPNEFIHIPYAKKLTACICHIVARQYTSS